MPTNPWAQRAAFYRNEFKQSMSLLMGIVTGLIADNILTDEEIRYLNDWLTEHDAVLYDWPADIINARVKAVLADRIITDEERQYLLKTLQDFVGGNPDTHSSATHVTELAFDDVETITFHGLGFCLTGDFVYAPRDVCENACVIRGGLVKPAVSKKVTYVIVGSLGSPAWKHGSFGTKIEKAVELKRKGAPLLIVKEDTWAAALQQNTPG